jgi:mono/diheme cytochrome c family protein
MRLRPVHLSALALVLPAASWADTPAKPQADSFATHVRPIVAKYCVGCHGEKKQSGELNLEKFGDAGAVVKDHETWETVKQRLQRKEMPPKNKPQPTEAERKTVIAWIDAELTRAGNAIPASPGRVTLRRLNRDEYNRTIHDLTGVTINPADEFPSDDVGHGFDNIGDVLSMPPILLEKYLNAAEKVVQRIFEEPPPLPEPRRIPAKELEATVKTELIPLRFTEGRSLNAAGSIFTNYSVPRDGELAFRVRLVARYNGEEPTRVAFRIDGKDIRTQPIRVQPNNQIVVEAKVKTAAGNHRLALALANPNDDKVAEKERRGFSVVWFEVVDPPEPPKRPAAYAKVMIGSPSDEGRIRARRILSQFAFHAYRRPPSDEEINRLVKLFEMARQQSEDFDKAVGVALQAVLVSPHFLFRVEPDRKPDRPDGSYALSDWEIASRMSYFLWSSMPDEELFRLAQQGKLRDPAVREAQVRRMLKDPRISALVESFGGQWLNLRNLQTVQPARRDFPAWDEALRSAMRTETELFFQAIIQEDRSILDFLDADFTFVNEKLAPIYGISGVQGKEFRRVKLTDRNRGGVLTQASVLTVTSNPTRTSPVKRGKWILDNILGTPPPPPPPDVPELKEDKESVLKGSLRERMQQHRANPSCATCHERMDVLGFGFENFDAIGAWRTQDGSFKIDSSGTLPDGTSFLSTAELKQILMKQDEPFRRCLTEKLLTYALGRGVEAGDRPALAAIAKAVADDGNRFNRMVLEIVQSEPFLRRTVKK